MRGRTMSEVIGFDGALCSECWSPLTHQGFCENDRCSFAHCHQDEPVPASKILERPSNSEADGQQPYAVRCSAGCNGGKPIFLMPAEYVRQLSMRDCKWTC